MSPPHRTPFTIVTAATLVLALATAAADRKSVV